MGLDFRDSSRRPRGRWGRLRGWVSAACLAWAIPSHAQVPADLQAILARLERLEEQNRALSAELQAVRDELAAVRGKQAEEHPSVEERVSIQESRIAEQAQTKVEAASGFPIRLAGMALFNTWISGANAGTGYAYGGYGSYSGRRSAGATFGQSTVGLDFSGPRSLWNARLSGSVRMDFYGGETADFYHTVRLRTATLGLEWKTRSLVAGISKPIVSAREPESLAHVAVPPLSGAGNLWAWLPQVRFEQAVNIGEQGGARFQFGVVQTREIAAAGIEGAAYETTRPGFQARVELFGGGNRRIEIAPGFHRSVSHVAAAPVPSQVATVDWLVRLHPAFEFTGAAFRGSNVAPLGTGPLRQGVVVEAYRRVRTVHSNGGWGQFTYRATPRLWFNVFTGQQDDRDRDLVAGGIGKNLAYGANLFFRLAPNVLASAETSQTRARFIGGNLMLSNRFDLALAYLF